MNGASWSRTAGGWRWAALAVILALGVLLPAGAFAFGPDAVRLEGEATSFSLEGHLAVLEDVDGALGVEDVARAQGFESGTQKISPGTRWYRFTVLRTAGMPADWILAFGEPDIDDIRVFVPTPEGGFSETHLGRRIPSRDLPIAALHHVAQVTLPEAEPVTVYMRLASQSKIRFEEVALWRPSALLFAEARQSVLSGINFGILAVIVVVYALFGFWLRDTIMLVYAGYVAMVLCQGISHTAVVALLFPDSGGDVNYLLIHGGLLGGVAAFIFMWDRVLDLRRSFPALHRVYILVAMVMMAFLPVVLSPAFPLVARAAQAASLAASVASIVLASILVYRHPGNTQLKFYLVAFFPVAFVWLVEFVARLSPLVPADLGRDIHTYGTKAHIAILSIALAYRLSCTQRSQIYAEAALAVERSSRQRLKTFIDMATHEFKTPLAVIDNTAQVLELLASRHLEVTERVAIIRRAVRRVVALIETCLAAERETALHLRHITPADLLRRVVERNLYPDRAPLIVNISGLPATCLADSDLLGIALDALIDNARRYGPADQPVELAAEGRDGTITLAVRDRGPGVSPDETGRIFEKYYRCTASGSIPGSGIGLHLVKVIAELHGGQIVYQPRQGGGASFVLTIPAR